MVLGTITERWGWRVSRRKNTSAITLNYGEEREIYKAQSALQVIIGR